MSRACAFTTAMVMNKIGALRCLHGMLEHDRITSREEFGDLMQAAFIEGDLDIRHLTDDLGFSASTVYRWVEGKSAPHPSLWPTVEKWIKAAIESKIGSFEDRADIALG